MERIPTTDPADIPGNTPEGSIPLAAFPPGGRSPSAVRLIVIPLIVFSVWVLETFLLEGSIKVFSRYQPVVYFMYILVANILIGTFAPVIFLKSGFLSGAVNMYQIGFRDLRRTVMTAGITACAGFLLLVAATPGGTSPVMRAGTILFLVPVAISSVMICWVLIGTHLQAYVRRFGTAFSIFTGVAVTGVLFGISFAAHSPPLSDPRHILIATGIGVATALVFFAIRDIWAALIFTSFALAWFVQGVIDPAYLVPLSPLVILTSVLSVISLAVSERYLMKRFVTIRLPVRPGTFQKT